MKGWTVQFWCTTNKFPRFNDPEGFSRIWLTILELIFTKTSQQNWMKWNDIVNCTTVYIEFLHFFYVSEKVNVSMCMDGRTEIFLSRIRFILYDSFIIKNFISFPLKSYCTYIQSLFEKDLFWFCPS